MLDRPVALKCVVAELLAESLAWVQLLGAEASLDRLQALTGRPGWEVELEVLALEEEGCLARGAAWRLLRRSPLLSQWSRERRQQAHLAIAARLPPGKRLSHWLAGLVEAAVLSRQAGTRALARYELERLPSPPPTLLALVKGSEAAERGDPATAIADLESLGELPELRLELLRRHLQARALARPGSPGVERFALWLAERAPWAARAAGDPLVAARYAHWSGLVAYRRQQFDDAAAAQLRAAELTSRTGEQLEYGLAAASALQEAGRLEEAKVLVSRVNERAIALRLAFLEARAVWLERILRVRSQETLEPDLELLDAMELLDVHALRVQQQYTESVIAFRKGHHLATRELAARAHRSAQRLSVEVISLMAQVLAYAADPTYAVDLDALAERLLHGPPRFAVEGIALLSVHGTLGQHHIDRALALADAMSPEERDLTGGTTTFGEARQLLVSNRPRTPRSSPGPGRR